MPGYCWSHSWLLLRLAGLKPVYFHNIIMWVSVKHMIWFLDLTFWYKLVKTTINRTIFWRQFKHYIIMWRQFKLYIITWRQFNLYIIMWRQFKLYLIMWRQFKLYIIMWRQFKLYNNYVKAIQALYNNVKCPVNLNDCFTKSTCMSVTNGVKQRCLMTR